MDHRTHQDRVAVCRPEKLLDFFDTVKVGVPPLSLSQEKQSIYNICEKKENDRKED
jgi:hypothetical protein